MQTQSLLTNLLDKSTVEGLHSSLVSILRQNRDEHNEAFSRAGILARVNTPAQTSNSTNEISVVNIALEAKAVNKTGALRLTVHGDLTNNTGGNVNYTFRGKLGASTFYNSGNTATVIGASANPRGWRFTADIVNKNAYNAQVAWGCLEITPANATQGVIGAAAFLTSAPHATLAIDLAAASTLVFSIQMGTASNNASFRIQAAILENLP